MKNIPLKEQAWDLGRRAYLKNISRIPHKDERLNSLMHDTEKDIHTTNIDLMSEWLKGWDTANLNDINDFLLTK